VRDIRGTSGRSSPIQTGSNALGDGARWKTITADPVIYMRLHSDTDRVLFRSIRTMLHTEPESVQSMGGVAFWNPRGNKIVNR
jgi:hypothetical protein